MKEHTRQENVKRKVYSLLAGRVPGIAGRYQRFRKDHPGMAGKVGAAAGLLWWNALYYGGRKESLRFPDGYGFYERRRLRLPESGATGLPSWKETAELLLSFDLVSFDVFDTLLLRPFREPADLFYLLGMRLSIPDFRHLRIEAEHLARKEDVRRGGSGEVTLEKIWRILSAMTGADAKEGQRAEMELERQYCQANPYFIPILERLRGEGKRLLLVSDMYLESDFIRQLLKEKGLGAFDGCFVSCQQGRSKWRGDLYQEVRGSIERKWTDGGDCRAVHVGDNLHADVRMAERAGFAAFWYPGPQEAGRPCRARDMSAVTGSMYAGLVNIRLHSGLKRYTSFYEYGYVYGGLLALGYCRFIHRFVRDRGIRRLWFLSRDGEVLKKVYDQLYPGEDTCYVLWSRSAAARLLSGVNQHDFFQRFLFQKADQGYSIRQIFASMELDFLLEEACRKQGWGREERLSAARAEACRDFLLSKWEEVQASYEREREAAGKYLAGLSSGAAAMAAVDVGWAGSGAASLDVLLRQVLGLPCRVYGTLAGTATVYSASPDTAEGFFFSGQMDSYLFSQSKNRDLWKFHNLGEKHNLYMELLFTSPSPGLRGFALGEEGEVVFRYGREEKHADEIRRIQKGILDFVRDYMRCFPEFLEGETGWISGRDAYAPLLLFLRDRRIRRKFEASFCWDTDVNVE